MVDIKYLKRQGVSSGDYKKIFTLNSADYPKPVKALVNLIRDRIADGRRNNLRDHRAYAAIDYAYNVPFAQTTPTLVQHILNQNLDAKATIDALSAWGLREDTLFLEVPIENGGVKKILNPPVFFQIFIPLVKAYVAIRAARIFNERNTIPLLPYHPMKQTATNQVVCEIITDLVDAIVTKYGYPAVYKQAIQQMLRYGTMLAFTREEWHCEKQMITQPDGTDKKIIVREGLRYLMPHPSQYSFDLKHPLPSLNSDTGVEWTQHWNVMRAGDVMDDPLYWNRRAIHYGTNWFISPVAGDFFKEVYPCQMKFPDVSDGMLTREERYAYYSTNDRDKALFVTEHFFKLRPRRWGLGNYDYPVWHRFTVAGDDTIIWAQPCAYNPTWFMGYDYDAQDAQNSSLALEVMPFQDHLGNLISQIILTSKQNLTNITFYDKQMVDPQEIRRMNEMGENRYRTHNFIGYDMMKAARASLNVDKAFVQVQLGKTSVAELQQCVPLVLNMLERVIQITAQETGTTAQHYQSKFEVQMTGTGASQRYSFTASGVDDGTAAWKQQLVDASQAYQDPTVAVQLSTDKENILQILGALGFQVEEMGDINHNMLVRGPKHRLRIDGFARTAPPPENHMSDREVAQVIMQTVAVVANNERLANDVGTRPLLILLEQAGKLAGAPADFKLRSENRASPMASPEFMQALQQVQQAILGTVQEKIAAPAAQAVAQTQQQVSALQQAVQQLQGIYKVAAAANDKLQVQKAEAAQKMQIEQAEFQAEQRRKEEAHQLEMRRETESAQIKLATDAAAAKLKIRSQQQLTAQKAQAKSSTPKAPS